MSESLLKKEFQVKDVNRIRNLVKKDFTAKTKTAIGYSKAQIDRKEGEVWEEDGRQWTIREGIKQNITKLDPVKDTIRVPLRCPKCGGSMNHWLAKKMYRIHGFCFDPCTVEYEASLRKAGLYEQYEKRMIQGNMKAFTQDIENWIIEQLEEESTFVTEQGDVEEWNSNKKNKEKILLKLKDFKEVISKHLD